MRHLRPIFLASFFFSIHVALLTYLNSSMLSRFGTAGIVSEIYMIGSVLSCVFLFVVPSVIRRSGLVKATIGILLVSSLLLFGISTTAQSALVVGFFALYFSLNVVITYFFDLLVEHYSVVRTTGRTRGLFLMINNIGWVGAPLIAGVITGRFGFSTVYLCASIAVLTAGTLIFASQRNFKDKVYQHGSIIKTFRSLPRVPCFYITTMKLPPITWAPSSCN